MVHGVLPVALHNTRHSTLSTHRYEAQQTKVGLDFDPLRWFEGPEEPMHGPSNGQRLLGFVERGTIVEARYFRGILPNDDEEVCWYADDEYMYKQIHTCPYNSDFLCVSRCGMPRKRTSLWCLTTLSTLALENL